MNKTARELCSGWGWQRATALFKARCAAANLPCHLCSRPIDYRLKHPHRLAFTVDHVVPLWDGGAPLNPRNWAPAHRSCNSSRGATEGNRLRRTARRLDRQSRRW